MLAARERFNRRRNPMTSIYVPKSRLVQAACRTDFLSFSQWCFDVVEPGSTLNMNWHHEAMAYHLELVRRGVIKRLIIAAPPRTLKSLMASVAFPAYVLGCDPSVRIIGISHGADLQIKFNNDRRIVIDSAGYHRLFPGMQVSKNTETEFHTTQGGYCYARSAEGSLTGIGGGILILDDFQKPQDMFSEARRTSTNSLYYKTVASRIDNQHTGAIVVIGQRLHPDDLIGRLLCSAEPWTELSLPAIAEKEQLIPIGPDRYHLRRVGDLLHPEQLSRPILEARKLEDPEAYAAQYQQSPIPPGGFMIKRDQIKYADELPRRTSSSVYIQSWDTAQKPGEANARSACLDILVQDNQYFIAHALVGQWEYYELEQRVLARAHDQKPNATLIEDAGFGTALITKLKQKGLAVIAVKPEGDKKTRLLRNMSKFTKGQVIVLRSAPGRAELETELFGFPGGHRNDLVDALSQALDYKHSRYVLNDTVNANYANLIATLALSCGRRFP
jgi:predicted phage terminase large subunit-like protein